MKLDKVAAIAAFSPGAGPKVLASILGEIFRASHFQGTAASLAAAPLWVADFDGKLDEAVAKAAAVAATNESMTVDILKNGASILLSTTAFVAGGKKVVSLAIDPDKNFFVEGDVFTTTRVYTAGGGPTPLVNTTVVIKPVPFGIKEDA